MPKDYPCPAMAIPRPNLELFAYHCTFQYRTLTRTPAFDSMGDTCSCLGKDKELLAESCHSLCEAGKSARLNHHEWTTWMSKPRILYRVDVSTCYPQKRATVYQSKGLHTQLYDRAMQASDRQNWKFAGNLVSMNPYIYIYIYFFMFACTAHKYSA